MAISMSPSEQKCLIIRDQNKKIHVHNKALQKESKELTEEIVKIQGKYDKIITNWNNMVSTIAPFVLNNVGGTDDSVPNIFECNADNKSDESFDSDRCSIKVVGESDLNDFDPSEFKHDFANENCNNMDIENIYRQNNDPNVKFNADANMLSLNFSRPFVHTNQPIADNRTNFAMEHGNSHPIDAKSSVTDKIAKQRVMEPFINYQVYETSHNHDKMEIDSEQGKLDNISRVRKMNAISTAAQLTGNENTIKPRSTITDNSILIIDDEDFENDSKLAKNIKSLKNHTKPSECSTSTAPKIDNVNHTDCSNDGLNMSDSLLNKLGPKTKRRKLQIVNESDESDFESLKYSDDELPPKRNSKTKPKTFLQKSGLRTEKPKKPKILEKNFVCREPGCGKAFQKPSGRMEHERIHSGERPFSCELCDKKFIQKSHLTAHMRAHLDVKPYICKFPNCDKRFTQRSNFDQHTRHHTGERPFTCPFRLCGKTYSQRSALISHKKKRHGSNKSQNSQSEII